MITSIENALVVDDDALMREFVVETLRRNKIKVTEASNGLDAKELLTQQDFDMAFVDLKMPGLDGMGLLKHMTAVGCPTLTVIITAFGTVERAVDAMKNGAYDFLMKPFSPEQVEIIINRARDWVGLQAQNTYLKEELGWILPQGRQIVGQSTAVQKLMKEVTRVAQSNATVLINGESGTGKELVASAIHCMSERKNQPFIRLNCAAVPEALMDSELFGHEKGSFTSAVARRIGRFELANHGTLLLDEISEMNINLQSKLLRVLQEREFERVGGSPTIQVDFRVLASTNRNLQLYVDEKKFRQDLYYRLNVVPIKLPPLRERLEDIPLLVGSFVQRHGAGRGKGSEELSFAAETVEAMQQYNWPGNIRELENVVERICVMEEGPVFGPETLPVEIRGRRSGVAFSMPETSEARPVNEPGVVVPSAGSGETLNIAELERHAIIQALRKTGGNRKDTAELLGISIRTLRNKLNQYREEGTLPEDIE
ncbi:MAG: sigma-54 dependent transcriptional regulator [Kiritimatiellae bacterium]|nr:sigma-54 dependent transcriptional regulator [Kiritimatiellia bacterium]